MHPPTSAESLSQRFKVITTEIGVADRTFDLLRPRSADDLIDDESFDHDDRLPYWAELWPSARVLAERVAQERGEGRSLLELGCGIGIVSLVAAHAGFAVLATDYYTEALEFVLVNAHRNGVANVSTRLVDWRRYPDDLRQFDLVVASDVLYERPNSALVANAFARSLSPSGLGLLTDPSRSVAAAFGQECERHGLIATEVACVRTLDGSAEVPVKLFEIRHSASRP